MRVVVVGGAGFIGRHLARRLHESGHESTTIDRRAVTSPCEGERSIAVDLLEPGGPERAARACGPADAVVWLAAEIRHRHGVDETALEDLRVMVEAPLRFLEALDRQPASLVYLSSIQVYGRPRYLPVDERHPTEPIASYGVAKLCAESYLRVACSSRDIPLACLRAAFVYGPGQHERNAIPRFFEAIRRGEAPLVLGGGRGVRDDVYVGDVAGVIETALARGASATVNIATGRPHTLLDVAETACRVAGTALRPRIDPADAGWVDRWYAVEEARRVLGFEARTSLEEGLRSMWMGGEGR